MEKVKSTRYIVRDEDGNINYGTYEWQDYIKKLALHGCESCTAEALFLIAEKIAQLDTIINKENDCNS